ncbi:MAG TPA: hypothetical protein VMU51_34175 [Mycobacteriales bacterium]|nr:hypothetical protein [Mycobacteriales bacterium]
MSWAKLGDNAADYPPVLRGGQLLQPAGIDLAGPGGALVRATLVLGFVVQCAAHSASHFTDYWIDGSVPWRMVGPAAPALSAAAAAAGLWAPAERDGVPGWQLVDDPDFIHLITRREKEWERQRRADSANPALTVPARRRDGDECRYCGKIVNWRARRGGRAGQYDRDASTVDHREPGRPAKVSTLVVACLACNSGRRDDPEADLRYPLRPVPARPFYGPETVEFLAAHGVDVPLSDPAAPSGGTPHPRPGPTPENASDPATPSGGTPHPAAHSAPDVDSPPPAAAPDTGAAAPDLQIPADPEAERRVGTGRVGSGKDGPERRGPRRAGTGRDGEQATSRPPALLAWCRSCQAETEHAGGEPAGTGTCLGCGTDRTTPDPHHPPQRPAAPGRPRRSRRGGRGRPRPGGSSP